MNPVNYWEAKTLTVTFPEPVPAIKVETPVENLAWRLENELRAHSARFILRPGFIMRGIKRELKSKINRNLRRIDNLRRIANQLDVECGDLSNILLKL